MKHTVEQLDLMYNFNARTLHAYIKKSRLNFLQVCRLSRVYILKWQNADVFLLFPLAVETSDYTSKYQNADCSYFCLLYSLGNYEMVSTIG